MKNRTQKREKYFSQLIKCFVFFFEMVGNNFIVWSIAKYHKYWNRKHKWTLFSERRKLKWKVTTKKNKNRICKLACICRENIYGNHCDRIKMKKNREKVRDNVSGGWFNGERKNQPKLVHLSQWNLLNFLFAFYVNIVI